MFLRYCVHKSVLHPTEVLIFPLHFSAVADLIHKGILLMDPQREVAQPFRNQTEQMTLPKLPLIMRPTTTVTAVTFCKMKRRSNARESHRGKHQLVAPILPRP